MQTFSFINHRYTNLNFPIVYHEDEVFCHVSISNGFHGFHENILPYVPLSTSKNSRMNGRYIVRQTVQVFSRSLRNYMANIQLL